ncbi:MAG: VOC family protein [Hyphomonadaceae bacterium]|nr:VOC family protein [Hyphomonadaceae bacterium]MBX3511215.1 VOC family protein [Hyphomonadaceae bacterium]
MPAAISYVTVPVDDLQKSLAFYQAAFGIAADERDEDHAALDLDGVYLVLQDRSEFGVYVESVGHRPAARGNSEVVLSYLCDSRGEVDDVLAKAKAAGATLSEIDDEDGIYSGYFTDPDGHCWEVLYDAS